VFENPSKLIFQISLVIPQKESSTSPLSFLKENNSNKINLYINMKIREEERI
jgi:hypothetical protein